MEKSWRPKDWENIKWTTIPYNAPAISGDELGKIFEAGADAMLEALKKRGCYMDAETIEQVTTHIATSLYPNDPKTQEILKVSASAGWIVKIPA